ncbi:5-dehydro-4-deoxy-D-glucuronate isomerase [Segetibacter sp. 3557_3]|uniref:5-dehydro-4-deoxy-D-glucuronate isomerase n=1 Tax=Segetibacter sp. 3557_3 TaxID=2547429 RepID=UPI001058F15D|nr:5-dehydro-4-deoxy-D-glucuronate isomerase [Segetibacter sp. 3557_3]TDH27760.1 5-dehydro-4-deoxy-D-glucuronate isomerase [Segetibacter sp. 3557_3]
MSKTLPILAAIGPNETKSLDSNGLRANFLLGDIYQTDELNLVYTHYDRLIAGVAAPAGKTLALDTFENLKMENFLDRREIGIINVGGDGKVTANGQTYELSRLDCLYAGKGAKDITFAAVSPENPPVFFLLSSPAHQEYPVTFMKGNDASPMTIGSSATANERTVYKYIYNDGIQSCQLVMGLTRLMEGSVWNTMPAHVHDRRSEIYFYFDVPAEHGVMHFMGEPQQTRHMVLKNFQAIASPSWSIHSGCGTSNYSFIWGMGGENKEYTDMDVCPITSLI